MRSILVLGPSRWTRARGRRASKSSLKGVRLFPGLPAPVTPLDLRRLIASALREHGIDGRLFEDWSRESGESYSRAFQRLIQVARIDRFLIIWPRGAFLLGVDWELGLLSSLIESDKLDSRRVALLVEAGVTRQDLTTGTLSRSASQEIERGTSRTSSRGDVR